MVIFELICTFWDSSKKKKKQTKKTKKKRGKNEFESVDC